MTPPARENRLVHDRLLGPAAPGLGWVPAPRYLLRRRRILRQLRGLSPSPVIEIGPGAGMLLQELSARGFQCNALETSPQARELITRLRDGSGHDIRVHSVAAADWANRFPLVMAFEVLEHIEDDRAALAQWASWLPPGGTLLLSVPAHPRQWNAADVWAGHFRRYARRELVELVEGAGLDVQHVECIGFPLGNLTERIQARQIERQVRETGSEGDREANNNRSGIERDGVLKWYPRFRSLPGKCALSVAFAMQAASSRLPLGNGYLVRARRIP